MASEYGIWGPLKQHALEKALADGQAREDSFNQIRVQRLLNVDIEGSQNIGATEDSRGVAGWRLTRYPEGTHATCFPERPYLEKGMEKMYDVRVEARNDRLFANAIMMCLPPTNAVFNSVFNVPGRSIVAEINASPAHMARTPVHVNGVLVGPRARLPGQDKWSDVIGILWAREAGIHSRALKYVWRYNITTPKTQWVIAKTCGDGESTSVPYWPGRTFHPGQEEFTALLGTAQGKGVAYLLTDHPHEFGDSKGIESITCWADGAAMGIYKRWFMLFTLTD